MQPRLRSLFSSLPRLAAALALAAVGLAPFAASAVTFDWVAIGNPGNPADTPSTNCIAVNPDCGSVSYSYYISKYEITNAQYAEFLNAADASGSNPLALYNASMESDATNGGIRFVAGNASGSKYEVKGGFASRPVTYVSPYDAMRFSNWLNNGQGGGSTETGAYTLLGGTTTPSNGWTVTRNAGASIFLPSENEWYKAAYYSPGGVYFDYPAGTDLAIVCSVVASGSNLANCHSEIGGVTPVGGYTNSASPYGTFDQGGNVSEWNENITSIFGARGFRGGTWGNLSQFLAASAPNNGSDNTELAVLGFRVASLNGSPPAVPIGDVAGPVVVGFLAMTGLLGLAYRQRRDGRAA